MVLCTRAEFGATRIWALTRLNAASGAGRQKLEITASYGTATAFYLRVPLGASIPGQKAGPFAWKGVSGWAEGFFIAAVKRAGQVVELQLAVERVFGAEPDALIAVCGDFNAEDRSTALRLVCAGKDDTGSDHLAPRVLTPVERSLPADRRFTVVHHGRPEMLDHILASRSMFARLATVEIHNEMLNDELIAYGRIGRAPESLHAPVLASFESTLI
jgi:hypothetical protein